uniref:Wu:fc75a09 n=1 Tax=Astyanax mexicanus TaxID=7994 RepID=A0A3B1K2I6_ASTMX
MVRKETLDTLPDLVDSGFGRPFPRHGLNLLYWFVTQCLQFGYNQITVDEDCDPSKRDYGFKPFDNEEKILPDTNLPYYEVGNLNPKERRGLPKYVWRGYTGNRDNSNTDRIIICINGSSLERLYVTRHKNQWTFNPNQTFCISPELLKTIRNLTQKDFLRQTTSRYITIPESTRETSTMQDYQLPPISAEKYCGMFLFLRLCAELLSVSRLQHTPSL